MSIGELAQQLVELTESLAQTNFLITRLAKLSFQPGSEPLDSEKAVRVELAQDIHDSLKQLEEQLELAHQDLEFFGVSRAQTNRRQSTHDTEKDRLAVQVARLEEDLQRSRSQFRRAQLTAKRAAEAAKQKERELVLANLQVEEVQANRENQTSPRDSLFSGRSRRQQGKLSKEEALVSATSDVTAALRRTHNLLSAELSRSRFAQETLEQSSAALADLGEKYTDLDTILSKSRNLLGTLLRSQKSDTWYLETAFYLLLATLCWLFFRRILFGPFIRLPIFLSNLVLFCLRWTLWKPLFFFLSVIGVITSEPAPASAAVHSVLGASSRTSLIVHASASSGPQAMGASEKQAVAGGMPAGAGGQGAKTIPEKILDGQLSEEIGQMAENSTQASVGGKQNVNEGAEEDDGVVRRGDGTILPDRSDQAPNPKKKMFDAAVEDQKKEQRQHDEL